MSYYHDYFVKDRIRTYYSSKAAKSLQVSEHHYVETALVKLWRTNTSLAWSVICVHFCPICPNSSEQDVSAELR